MTTDKNLRVASVQASSVFLDGKATVEKGVGLIEQAARNGAEVVVFSETWVPGYPVWATRIRAWRLHEAGQRLFARLFENSVDVPGSLIDTISKAARHNSVHVVLGVNERDSEYSRGSLYNTILFFGRDGTC